MQSTMNCTKCGQPIDDGEVWAAGIPAQTQTVCERCLNEPVGYPAAPPPYAAIPLAASALPPAPPLSRVFSAPAPAVSRLPSARVPSAPPPMTPAPIAPAPVLQYQPRSPLSGNLPDQLLSICVSKADVPVFATMDANATPLRTMAAGELFSIGTVVKEGGVKRVSATLLNGTRVFLPNDAKVFRVRGARLQGKTKMYSAPSLASAPVDTLRRGTEVVLVDQVQSAEGKLVSEIRDGNGRAGYIDGKVKVLPVAARPSSAGKDMLVGGILCLVGVGITIGTYSAVSDGGGTYVIAWGPAIWGAIRFFKGLSRIGSGPPSASILERMIPQIVQEKTGGQVLAT